jgi:hypothetical protein
MHFAGHHHSFLSNQLNFRAKVAEVSIGLGVHGQQLRLLQVLHHAVPIIKFLWTAFQPDHQFTVPSKPQQVGVDPLHKVANASKPVDFHAELTLGLHLKLTHREGAQYS